MMNQLIVSAFAIATGVTLSGVITNTYRLIAGPPNTTADKVFEVAVLVMGGPVILVRNSTKSFRKKECSAGGYVFALGLSGLWSFATGVLFLITLIALEG
jgi:hypothetical protein